MAIVSLGPNKTLGKDDFIWISFDADRCKQRSSNETVAEAVGRIVGNRVGVVVANVSEAWVAVTAGKFVLSAGVASCVPEGPHAEDRRINVMIKRSSDFILNL
jgi:hypothetical protein